MKMSVEDWSLIQALLESRHGVPDWVRKVLAFRFDQLSTLPVLDQALEGVPAQPSIQLQTVAVDYLDFLREQIQLGARGPEWSAVLTARLNALEPFCNSKLLTVRFFQKPHSFTVRIDPKARVIIHTET